MKPHLKTAVDTAQCAQTLPSPLGLVVQPLIAHENAPYSQSYKHAKAPVHGFIEFSVIPTQNKATTASLHSAMNNRHDYA